MSYFIEKEQKKVHLNIFASVDQNPQKKKFLIDCESVFKFIPTRQPSEMIINISSKITENDSGKRQQVFSEN
jgi:hypothetical protein